MVARGSGGIFNGITYTDEDGRIRNGADYILNRIPYAHGLQYEQMFWASEKVKTFSKLEGKEDDPNMI